MTAAETPPCSCPLAGYCERHQMNKPDHLHNLCKTRADYRALWDAKVETPSPAAPGIVEQGAHFIEAGMKWAASGFKTRPAKLIESIYTNQCRRCVHFLPDAEAKDDQGVCGKCMCRLAPKFHPVFNNRNKIGWATEECPIGKWKAYTAPAVADPSPSDQSGMPQPGMTIIKPTKPCCGQPAQQVPAATRPARRRTSKSRRKKIDPDAKPKPMQLSDFNRIVCVNLDRRPDRWKEFSAAAQAAGFVIGGDYSSTDAPDRRLMEMPPSHPDYEKAVRLYPHEQPHYAGPSPIERVPAIDGKLTPTPGWWKQGPGAWGCYRTHMRILEDCINQKWDSYLVFEDDATFLPGFQDRVAAYLRDLPDDWAIAYLGGQHLHTHKRQPRRVTSEVYKAFNVNRTHAFAVRNTAAPRLYQRLSDWANWKDKWHIDHVLGSFTETGELPVYCPGEWLVGQGENKSDINGKQFGERFWPSARAASGGHIAHSPFVAVVGLHNSGSSALAGLLYYMDVYMGGKLAGFYTHDKDVKGGEAQQLAKICEDVFPFPTDRRRVPIEQARRRLQNWIDNKRKEARAKRTIAGGKYPTLCLMGEELKGACGDRLRVITIERPLKESIDGLHRRNSMRPKPLIEEIQTALWKSAFGDPSKWIDPRIGSHTGGNVARFATETKLPGGWVSSLPAGQVLRVSHHDLLYNTEAVARRIIDFLKPVGFTEPNPVNLARAIKFVKPEMRHVNPKS